MTFGYFFNVKQKRLGCRFHSEDEIDRTIKVYFASILRNGWLEAPNPWKIRLQKYINLGGNYF